jgi:predicted permease
MLRNYFKIAWRNLFKNKVFSFINITGLAVGIASAVLILLWVQFETSFDRFHQNYKDIYQVMENQEYEKGEVFTSYATPAPLAKTFKTQVPEVLYSTRVSWGNQHLFTYGDKHLEEFGLYVDNDFLKMFSIQSVQGNIQTALQQPNTLLISQKLAEKYFGNNNPVGKTIRVDEDRLYLVQGVFKNMPTNSTLQFDYLMPAIDYIKLYMNNEEQWDNNNIRTFVQLKPGVDVAALSKKIEGFLSQFEEAQNQVKLLLHPARDWHLRATFRDGENVGGQITYVRLFIVVAVFILLLACINFMNLTTAQATKRGKEVGVRKVMGGDKTSLLKQFLGESVFLTFLAGLLALFLVYLSLPLFNHLLKTDLSLDIFQPKYIGAFLFVILFTGLIAGSYPAFVLSSFQPMKVLKGAVVGGRSKAYWLRKGLVILQFVISVVMIISTIIVLKQIEYIRSKNLGYNRENLIYFPSAGVQPEQYQIFKEQLSSIPGVKSVTRSSINFTGSNNSTSEVNWPGKAEGDRVLFHVVNADPDVVKTFDIKMKDGRGFSASIPTDTSNFIINETAARRMALQSPVGQQIDFWGRKGTIIGVAKDFHITSVHTAIEPVIIQSYSWTWTYFLRIDGSKTADVINQVEKVYKSRVPERPFVYHFMDDEYEKMYSTELQVNKLSKWFSGLAIFISCLGLFGLVSFSAAQRTKEIGIRKVLGASVTNIISLLSKDLLKLVLIASIISFPIAWWMMSGWLSDFAYHISIPAGVFVLSALLAIIIALITISFQAIKSALANPVKNLRTE